MNKLSKNDTSNLRRNSIEFVRDFFKVGKVKKIFHIGTELISSISPFIENQTPVNALHAVFNVGKIIVNDLELWPDDFFDQNWTSPYPFEFIKIVVNSLKDKPHKVIRTSDELVVIHVVQLEDTKIAYTYNLKSGFIDRLCVEIDKLERTKELVKVELWKTMKDNNIVLRHVRNSKCTTHDASMTYESGITIEIDEDFRPMPSKRASEYSTYLRRCIDAGVSRSVMLYGPPGTGKSTMARTIVSNLGMNSFRIRVEDIGQLETSTIFEAIDIFEPDAVILDDFDRSGEQAALLETLEHFQRHVKLVVATVNNKNLLDEAILRPGRFDELLQIKQMDRDVVWAVLGKEHSDAYETVKDWPIAFIHEYVKRRRFMDISEAANSTKELALRVDRLKKYDDDDEIVTNKMIDGNKKEKKKSSNSSFNRNAIANVKQHVWIIAKKNKRSKKV